MTSPPRPARSVTGPELTLTDPAAGNTDPVAGDTDPAVGNADPAAGSTDRAAGNADPVAGDAGGAMGRVGRLAAALAECDFPDHVTQHLTSLVPVLRSDCGAGSLPGAGRESATDANIDTGHGLRPTDGQLMDAAEGLLVLQRWADARLAGVLADVVEAAGDELLARDGLAGPEEMSKTARVRWRAKAKSVVAHELQVATGWGIQDCHDRVGFALGPRLATAVPLAAWETGEVQWNQVRAWWSTCREMPVEVASQVAARTFGPHSDRVESARNGNVDLDDLARAGYGETKDTLARLVAALLGEDPKEARKHREAAVARRGAAAEIEDDGTGCLTITGRTSSVVAAMDRLDRTARAFRASGDQRTLSQLRSDIGLSLLIHGTTAAPAAMARSTRTTAAGSDGVQGGGTAGPVVAGARGHDTPEGPPAGGGPPGGRPGGASPAGAPPGVGPPPVGSPVEDPPDVAPPLVGSPVGDPPDVAPPPGDPPDAVSPSGDVERPPRGVTSEATGRQRHSPCPQADADVLGGVDDALDRVLNGAPQVNLEVIVPLDVLLNPDSVAVGMIPGQGYLSAEQVRALAASAGGVLHRLVTDPLDGRLVERTLTSYRPDAAMRSQVEAADVQCRAPGCRVPAASCEFDHEARYAESGRTSEADGDLKHKPHHQLVTWDVWQTELDASRRVTWTTLFGRCYVTRAFDYRLLTQPWTPGRSSSAGGDGSAEPRERWQQAVSGDADLQDRLIYAALAHREPGDRLAGLDDYPDPESREIGGGWLHHQAPIQLRHRTRRGQRRKGPASDQPTPEEILGMTEGTVGENDGPPPF